MNALWISLRLPRPREAYPALQEQLLRYTPRLTRLEPQQLALEISGSLRLFGGARRLWRLILRCCPPETRAAMAPTAWGAALLARGRSSGTRGPHRALRSRTLQRYLDRLPCAVLADSGTASAQLHAWGCATLGMLRRLPRAGLAQRGLADVLQQLDRAYGPDTTPYRWVGAVPGFSARRELPYHSARLSTLERTLALLLEALCAQLQAHQAACDQLFITLHHDDARIVSPATKIALSFSQPQWRVQTLLPLCRLRLMETALPGPVKHITVQCPRWQPRQMPITSLLPDAQADRQREGRLLDILRARLGTASLKFPQLQDWPLPEHAEHWSNQPIARSRQRLPEAAHESGQRPLWLLSPPASIPTQRDRLHWQGRPLHLVSGPERIESGWWREEAPLTRRDYFIAQGPQAMRYWIFHDLSSGGWFLHGLFA